jgi:D-arabinose 1-dehydrogenase-like Zn-dependent alcohol dehydrogenase
MPNDTFNALVPQSGAFMTAARLDAACGELTIEQVPVPDVGATDVLIRVQACGICLSDAHLIDGTITSSVDVVTLGHEPAGIVAAVGAAVPKWVVGDRVVLDAGHPCGRCDRCAIGMSEQCTSPRIMGVDYDGSWAEYVAVPYTTLCSIPDSLPFEQAALMADAISTPYAALVDTAQLRPSQSVGLWGIGGLGFHAVQIALLCGAAPVIAVDPRSSARQRALDVGADAALDPQQPDFDELILSLTDGLGLEPRGRPGGVESCSQTSRCQPRPRRQGHGCRVDSGRHPSRIVGSGSASDDTSC